MKYDEEFCLGFDLGELTKNKLLEDPELAESLAEFNLRFGKHPLAQDFDVLELGDGWVAKWLAMNCRKNGWGNTDASKEERVLKLRNGAVAHWLREYGYFRSLRKKNEEGERKIEIRM